MLNPSAALQPGARSRAFAGLIPVLLLSAVFPALIAQAVPPGPTDVIVFSNGDQLTGTLLRSVGETITFRSEMAGEITVPLAKIRALRSAGRFAVLRRDRPATRAAASTGSVSVANGELSVTVAPDQAEPVPAGQLAYVIDQPTYLTAVDGRRSVLSGWAGNLSAGATLVRSTENSTTLAAGAALVREMPGVAFLPPHNRTLFNLAESYGKLTNPVIPQTLPASPVRVAKTNIFHADAEFDRYFSPRLYALADTDFDHNYAQGLQLQQIYGAGIGMTAVKRPTQQLDLKAEAHYERQKFLADAANQNLIGGLFGEAYRRNLPLKLVFTESGTVDPAFNNTNAYSAQVQAALAIPAFRRLGFSLSGADSYLHNPPAGYKRNSVQLLTGVTYSLH